MSDTAPPSSGPTTAARAPSPPAPPTLTAPPRTGWREITLRLVVLAVAGCIVALFATQWDRWVGDSVRQETDDAYVQADITPLSAQVDGYVRAVPVDDFQYVKKGDLLFGIED